MAGTFFVIGDVGREKERERLWFPGSDETVFTTILSEGPCDHENNVQYVAGRSCSLKE